MTCSDVKRLCQWLDEHGRQRVIDIQTQLTAVPALAPENGGQGETAKARVVESMLPDSCIVEHCNAPDSRVPEEYRPNIIARISGKTPETLWIMGHLDVVPPGERSLWQSDPWIVQVDGDLLYGRGVEDNQQAIVSMLLLAEAVAACGGTPRHTLGLLFVADEECGSVYGMDHVLSCRRDLFRESDLVIVPDMGVPDGSLIEVAEKSIFWVRVEVTGVQCHASTPALGKNALAAAAEMIVHVNDAAACFPRTDDLFDEPRSTFAPTRHEENVANVNTVPGREVFYIDCRVVPGYTADDVLAAFERTFTPVASRHGVKVSLSLAQNTPAAPPTSPDSPVVRLLAEAIQKRRTVQPRCVGVGGGTVAAVFRRAGIPAVVWGTQDGTMHCPNEHSRISYAIEDAKIFAEMLYSQDV